MPLTPFPGGISSFGIPVIGGTPEVPTGPVWWVGNRTGTVNGDGTSKDRPFASLADALARVQTTNPYFGETIYILPGYTDNVTGADTFSASATNTSAVTWTKGIRIRGLGDGSLRPTFTFTATGSKLTINADAISFENCIFTADPAVATTVTTGFVISGKYCGFRKCYFTPAISTKGIFTTMLSVGAGANDADGFFFHFNEVFAPTLATNPTNLVKISQVENNVSIIGNVIQAATSVASVGPINVAAAATLINIQGNTINNLVAASAACIKGTAAMTGLIAYNACGVVSGSTANNTTVIDTPGNACLVENYGAKIGLAGALCGGTPA